MKRLVIGVSGASGAIYAFRMLDALSGQVESHLIISKASRTTVALETDFEIKELEAKATYVHETGNLAAPISSGSFLTDGMVIIPCSIKTLSGVANSYNENLLIRAADVTLKERRKLVLVVRETPLHIGHLKLMVKVSEMGAVIFPPVPAFYHGPRTIDDVINQTVGKILDLFGVEHRLFKRWK
jgi:4-hydroxy-3-polyprenylbenzoate decarboxylase